MVREINSKMELVIDTGNQFTSKKAVIVLGEEFQEELYGENNYFMFTNLSYRTESLRAMKALKKLPKAVLQGFLDELKNSRYMFSASMIGPDANGGHGDLRYPGISKVFKGGSAFLYRRNRSGDKLYVFERGATDFECFRPKERHWQLIASKSVKKLDIVFLLFS